MVEQIVDFFGRFGVWVVVLVCASLPVIETKIAVPLGISTEIWGNSAMSLWSATLVAFLGSSFVAICFFVVCKFIAKTIEKHKKPKIFLNFLQKSYVFLQKPLKKFSTQKGFKLSLFLILFVALPLPICGLFSGAILCTLLKVSLKQGIFVLLIGNLFDCLFVFFVCFVFSSFVPLLLTVFVIIALMLAISKLFEFFFSKKARKNAQN